MPINVSSLASMVPPEPVLRAAPDQGLFQHLLTSAIERAERSRGAASQHVATFLAGGAGDLHSTALAVQRADLEFELMLQLRNKVVSAYQEIMRMQM